MQKKDVPVWLSLALIPVAVVLAPLLWVAAIVIGAGGAGHVEAGI